MSIHLRRPQPEALRALLDSGKADPLTYGPVGMSASAVAPNGYRLDRWSTDLGRGQGVFAAARHALGNWQIQRGAGLVVLADGPVIVGAIVAMSAPLPVGYVDAVCRVTDVVDFEHRYGFAYGTLSVHPEQGEESFSVVHRSDDSVTFQIVAVSRPRHPLARMFPSIARMLQGRAVDRYLTAMRTAGSV